ncbi:MAG TPA: hypothetical protein VMV32_06960 [Ignavibacteriaceae bacterium]|nr:hypothetical protein [Ignavibacteriaceae bacterium]
MKKLNVILSILIFAISIFIYSCTASGGVTISKQQNGKMINSTK